MKTTLVRTVLAGLLLSAVPGCDLGPAPVPLAHDAAAQASDAAARQGDDAPAPDAAVADAAPPPLPLDAAPDPDAAVEPPGDGGVDPRVVTAPPGVWTWVPVPETRCMNGSATGFAVNVTRPTDPVLVYLEGGGACFDDLTCLLAAHGDGFGARQLGEMATTVGTQGVFNRTNADNPFRDFNFVFIPYCSGDVHAGNAVSGWRGRVQIGYANIGYDLARIVPTFARAPRVVLAGSSAGGVGAGFNYDRVARAFGATPVALVDDSGPVMRDMFLRPCLQRQWRDLWNLDATLPAGCVECRAGDGGLVNALVYTARVWPAARLGLIASDADATFRQVYGIGESINCHLPLSMSASEFAQGIADLRTTMAPFANFAGFYVHSDKHVYLLDEPLGDSVSAGVRITDWLRPIATGTGAFSSVVP